MPSPSSLVDTGIGAPPTMLPQDVPLNAPVPLEQRSNLSPTTGKRKAVGPIGPSREIYLPPKKKGGRRGPMTLEQRKNRKDMRGKGACIMCRTRKKKVRV
jgi:hypothetical protein